MKRTRHVRCNLCCPNGNLTDRLHVLVMITRYRKSKTCDTDKEQGRVSSKLCYLYHYLFCRKELYRRARKSNWGDTLAVPRDMYDAPEINTDQQTVDDTQENVN